LTTARSAPGTPRADEARHRLLEAPLIEALAPADARELAVPR
jgi:hypothetical protein